ncbi:MAG: DUF4177 domain-containing protein [Pseudomonadota bacterium]
MRHLIEGVGPVHRYKYKIVPAPTKGQKGPGVKGVEARFAHGLETAINSLASEGWEYLCADILPSEERQGLTSSQTVYRSVLVFRRALVSVDEPVIQAAEEPDETTAPDPVDPEKEELPELTEEVDETAEAEDPPTQVKERALNSLYAPSDNSKQD